MNPFLNNFEQLPTIGLMNKLCRKASEIIHCLMLYIFKEIAVELRNNHCFRS